MIEAYSGAQFWGRKIGKLGDAVRLMPPGKSPDPTGKFTDGNGSRQNDYPRIFRDFASAKPSSKFNFLP